MVKALKALMEKTGSWNIEHSQALVYPFPINGGEQTVQKFKDSYFQSFLEIERNQMQLAYFQHLTKKWWCRQIYMLNTTQLTEEVLFIIGRQQNKDNIGGGGWVDTILFKT